LEVFAKGYDPETLLSVSQPQSILEQFEAPAECVVCMSNAPTTIVQPCGHRVACQDCSDKMNVPGSLHRLICVMCRTPITSIHSTSRGTK
jgi:primosomal protein N'